MKNYKKISGDYYEKAQFESHKAQMFFYKTREDYLLEMLPLNEKSKVLEIGCGSGIL